ncbi:MAG TPA: sigma-70 family RNA polymerase sigma factor [Acidimicrobiales bacterium]|nr:sigma-70 family RNA polymerase sigma factor [Acidimicrobiales bacterium]
MRRAAMTLGPEPDERPKGASSWPAERPVARPAHAVRISAAREGASWAVAALYREIHPRLVRYLRSREPEVADDVAAQVWLEVAGGLDKFEGTEDGFRAWVFTIARRRLIDARRRARRRPTDPLVDQDFVATSPDGDPEGSALAALDAQAAVDRIVAALTPDQAEVVLLRVLGGLPVGEVAAVLGKQPSAVRVLQHRALRRLAQHLEPEAEQ